MRRAISTRRRATWDELECHRRICHYTCQCLYLTGWCGKSTCEHRLQPEPTEGGDIPHFVPLENEVLSVLLKDTGLPTGSSESTEWTGEETESLIATAASAAGAKAIMAADGNKNNGGMSDGAKERAARSEMRKSLRKQRITPAAGMVVTHV